MKKYIIFLPLLSISFGSQAMDVPRHGSSDFGVSRSEAEKTRHVIKEQIRKALGSAQSIRVALDIAQQYAESYPEMILGALRWYVGAITRAENETHVTYSWINTRINKKTICQFDKVNNSYSCQLFKNGILKTETANPASDFNDLKNYFDYIFALEQRIGHPVAPWTEPVRTWSEPIYDESYDIYFGRRF